MSHRVGRKSQLSNREYEFDNYSIDTVSCLDRWSADGLQSVSYLQVRITLYYNKCLYYIKCLNSWILRFIFRVMDEPKSVKLTEFYSALSRNSKHIICSIATILLSKLMTAVLLVLKIIFQTKDVYGFPISNIYKEWWYYKLNALSGIEFHMIHLYAA